MTDRLFHVHLITPPPKLILICNVIHWVRSEAAVTVMQLRCSIDPAVIKKHRVTQKKKKITPVQNWPSLLLSLAKPGPWLLDSWDELLKADGGRWDTSDPSQVSVNKQEGGVKKLADQGHLSKDFYAVTLRQINPAPKGKKNFFFLLFFFSKGRKSEWVMGYVISSVLCETEDGEELILIGD